MRLLVCWIGRTDLDASIGQTTGIGPIAQALQERAFDEVHLLANYPAAEVSTYVAWLRRPDRPPIVVHSVTLSSPMNFGEIWEAAVAIVAGLRKEHGAGVDLTYHLSPGTSAMAAVWVILAKTRFAAELILSSIQKGVETASVPFDISADFLPELLRRPDEELERLSAGLPPEAPEFDAIIHRCAAMRRVIGMARRVAARSVPVLIEGESGTGKDLLARAIHQASPRRDRCFISVNCGALSPTLIESTLFGHTKGAFTGADRAHKGLFEEADGGTIFLDEVGELTKEAQVKLLRVLQNREIVPVGAARPIAIDVRVLAATNRVLAEEVASSRFREDLFYRLAVAVLRLPALRERQGDLSLLIERLMEQVNEESKGEPGFERRSLSASARTLLLSHRWPGNVRELLNTLRRAAIWSTGATIRAEDAREAILPITTPGTSDVLNRPLGEGLDLRHLLGEVATHYLERALDEAHGNKTVAAQLVGLESYQTLTNWLKRYGLERSERGRSRRLE